MLSWHWDYPTLTLRADPDPANLGRIDGDFNVEPPVYTAFDRAGNRLGEFLSGKDAMDTVMTAHKGA
jgi:hypothetical protein